MFKDAFDEVVASFVKQYYLKADFIPKEIYLPAEIPEQDQVETWLSERAGGPVKIIVPKQGERAKLVAMCGKNAQLLLKELQLQKARAKDRPPHSVQALQRDLHLKHPPRRIEAFDISNIQGTDPVASMVCFVDGVAKKSDYRRFKIRSKQTPDDFAMMREAIARRYGGSLAEKLPLPDLILVDGGKGQLSAALQALKDVGKADIPVVALAKRLDEVFVPGQSEPQNIPRTSSGLKLLQRLRDESHRFANTFHRELRKKRTAVSELENIPGIGPARRRALLKYYGSVQAIREASVDDLLLVDGINEELARAIWDYFHAVKAES